MSKFWFLHRKPTVQTLSVSSLRWSWRTTTPPGCQHITLAGTLALPKRVDLAEGLRLSRTSKKCTSWSAFLPASSRTCSTAASPPLARGTDGRRRPALVLTHGHNTFKPSRASLKDADTEDAWTGVILAETVRCRSRRFQLEVKIGPNAV